jgi:HK97 family phage major capsid protein
MASVTELRAELKALDAEIMALHHDRNAPGGLREFTPKEQTQYDNLHAEREVLAEKIAKHEAIADGAKDPSRSVVAVKPDKRSAPNVNYRSAGKAWQVRDDAAGDELRGRAVDALEGIDASDESIRRALDTMIEQSRHVQEKDELARRIAVCSNPDYARAFAKLAVDPTTGHNTWTSAERAAWDKMLEARAAMAIGAGATGGYMVPTHLDPTIILTNNGSSNVIRQISREVTLASQTVWNGISSAGVTASYDSEATEVSDDSPTLANPQITTYQAQAFVRASVQAWDDIANLESEVHRLFADAKDRLEEAKFTVGAGSTEPTGVFTTIAATTASRVVSTTAATIGVVDLKAVYRAVPARHRRVANWLSNSLYTLTVKDLGTAVSSSYSGDLREPAASRWYDLPVVESDDAPTTQTTTALDAEILLGDFSQFVIVDRLGASAEFIPHLFGGSGRPTGERGVYFRFRNGSGVTNTNAFRLLVDKTSA